MKKTTIYSLVLALFIIFQLFIISIFTSSKEKDLENVIENQRINFISTYNTIFSTYSYLPLIVFEGRINNKYITSLLSKANDTDDMEYKDLIRQEIYEQLKDAYHVTLGTSGFKQLQFHLKDGESFLRFSNPKEYGDNLTNLRYSIKEITKSHKAIEGFESGKFLNGYRYIYPLFYEDAYVGSVEIVLDIDTYLALASKGLKGEQRFIIRQNMISKSTIKASHKKYIRSCLNSNYLFQKDADLPMLELLNNLPKDKKAIIGEKLKYDKDFSVPIQLDDQAYITNFMPIFDMQKNVSGFIVGIQQVTFIDTINSNFIKNIGFTLVSSVLILLILFGYFKEKMLLKEIVKINESLEDKVEKRTKELKHNAKLLETILETIPTPIFYKNLDGKYLSCNEEFAKLLKLEKNQIIGSYATKLFSKNISGLFEEIDKTVLQTLSKQKIETNITFENNSAKNFEIYKNIIMKDAKPFGIIGLMYDITELKRYQKQLQDDYNIIQKYTIYSKMDLELNITEVSDGFCKILGRTREEIIGKRHHVVLGKNIDDTMLNTIRGVMAKGKEWEGELLNTKKNGQKVWTRTKITPEFDKNHEIISFTTFSQDISTEKIIQEHAYKDELTKLFNRKKFNEELVSSIVMFERYRDDTALILFDIDKFKDINDIHGHLVGDKILVDLANVVSSNIRECDILARWGGEEFALILPKTDIEKALITTKKLRQKIIEHDFNIGHSVTCSFGVTAFKEGDDTISLIKRVDDMLYCAKKEGRDRIIFD